MATLYHQVWINAPVSKVYEALATADGLGKWWAHIHPPKRMMVLYWHTVQAESTAPMV